MGDLIGNIFHAILYQPFLNALVALYEFIPGKDFGVAVILLTIILRFVLYPLSARAFRAQKALAELQPKVQEIQEKFKNSKGELSKKLMELYQKERINPFASFLPLLIQFPILIALFQVFRNGFHPDQLSALYSFIPRPEYIDSSFFGLLDLNEKSILVAVLAAAFQYVQGKQSMSLTPKSSSQTGMARAIQGPILYMIPLMTGFFAAQLPSALGLYWITTSLFSIWQQWNLQRTHNTKPKAP
ncbi:MAG: membrane protein insertase YidC [Candidatus Wildermuthbacteria bacterium]|nr:membrane protein insertase YidC [Candidatus Wildermuthbacteria bacterium]